MRRAARYLAISSKKSRCALKKNESRGAKSSTSSPRSRRPLDVGEPVRERERELLRGVRAGLADVVAGDRDRVPLRHLARAELDHVGDEPHRRLGREDALLLRDVLLEDVRLDRPAELRARDALLLADARVEGEQDRRGRVDRHRRRDLAERDAGEQRLHVVERVDRDALAADLAERARVVGVVAHQRRHVEGGRETRLAVLEQVAEALVRLLGGAEPGELPHRPELAAVHRRVDAARERIDAGEAEVALRSRPRRCRRVERLVLDPRDRGEELAISFGRGLVELPPRRRARTDGRSSVVAVWRILGGGHAGSPDAVASGRGTRSLLDADFREAVNARRDGERRADREQRDADQAAKGLLEASRSGWPRASPREGLPRLRPRADPTRPRVAAACARSPRRRARSRRRGSCRLRGGGQPDSAQQRRHPHRAEDDTGRAAEQPDAEAESRRPARAGARRADARGTGRSSRSTPFQIRIAAIAAKRAAPGTRHRRGRPGSRRRLTAESSTRRSASPRGPRERAASCPTRPRRR